VRGEPLAALAIALLVLESFARRRPQILAAPLALATVCGLLIAATPSRDENSMAQIETELRDDPIDPARLVALGVARIERGEHRAGMRALHAAALSSSDLDLAALAWYDLGVAALETGELERARDAFFDAIALAPHDREARFNLEWTLDALRSQAPASAAPAQPELPEPPIQPPPTASPEVRESELREAPAPMDAARQRRLLLSVHDDLRQALRSAARAEAPRKQPGRPAW
jgi:tetratricopeptide (TPR) repeat protein